MVTITNYIYDGFQYLGETDENNVVTRRYVNEPDRYTRLIAQHDVASEESRYYHYDAIGSTRAVTDENEDVTDTFTYDAWGNVLSRTGTNGIPFQYIGRNGYYHDNFTNTYHVNDRIYFPSLIRWASRYRTWMLSTISDYVYVIRNSSAIGQSNQGEWPEPPPLPEDEGSSVTKTLSCPKDSCNPCDGGNCKFRIDTFPSYGQNKEVAELAICFGQEPWEPTPEEPLVPGSCFSGITRTANQSNRIAITLADGTVCDFRHGHFLRKKEEEEDYPSCPPGPQGREQLPPFSFPEPIHKCEKLIAEIEIVPGEPAEYPIPGGLPTRCLKIKNPLGPAFKKVFIEMDLKIACCCNDKFNSGIISFRKTFP